MKRKQLVYAAVIMLATLTLVAAVSYRLGVRRASRGSASRFVSREAAGCIDFREAPSHTGQAGCIRGRVLRVYTARSGATFLDFCSDYRRCPFSTVIFASERRKFGDLTSLENQQVEIRGPIVSYRGRSEIILHDSEQLHVLR